MSKGQQKLQVIPLGGLGEIGKNMTVIRVDDVPAALLEDLPRWAEIVSNIPAAVDVDALRQEREKLAARIADIDAILTQANA